MKIVLAGASGFIGQPLIDRLLGTGHTLVVLSRHDARTERGGQVRWVKWDSHSAGEWARYLEDAKAVSGSVLLFCRNTVFLSLIQPYPPHCRSRLIIREETCRNHPV